ncbi:MAG: M24 family metallopeptidase [Candidatus Omnitrophota bacterium]
MEKTKMNFVEVGKIAGKIINETLPEIDVNLVVTQEEYKHRWQKIQVKLKEKGYDVGYACGSEMDRSDIAWMAGVFDPIVERYGILIGVEGPPVILAGSEGGHVVAEAKDRSGAEVSLLREFQISDEDYRHTKFDTLENVLKKMGVPKNGKAAIFASSEFVPYHHVVMLQAIFGSDNVSFDPLLLQLIKYEKSEKELAICQMSNIVSDAAFRAMLAVCVPGMTELQVAGAGDFVMKELGAGRQGFPTIVTAGKRGYTIIGPATNNRIQEGDIVSMGISGTFNGYHGIIRRTIRAGKNFSPDQMEVVRAVEGLYTTVMDATIEAAKTNAPSNTIDLKGKEYIAKLKLKALDGSIVTPQEPYTFIHNAGCSEASEGYGAITPYTQTPIGERATLMCDVALKGFINKGEPLFNILYAVVEDSLWKCSKEAGVYNRLPINVQHLVGNTEPLGNNINPYHKYFSL